MLTNDQVDKAIRHLDITQKTVVLMLGDTLRNGQRVKEPKKRMLRPGIEEQTLLQSVWRLRNRWQLYYLNKIARNPSKSTILINMRSSKHYGIKRKLWWFLTEDGEMIYRRLKADGWYLADA